MKRDVLKEVGKQIPDIAIRHGGGFFYTTTWDYEFNYNDPNPEFYHDRFHRDGELKPNHCKYGATGTSAHSAFCIPLEHLGFLIRIGL